MENIVSLFIVLGNIVFGLFYINKNIDKKYCIVLVGVPIVALLNLGYCAVVSMLYVACAIDFKTKKIPNGLIVLNVLGAFLVMVSSPDYLLIDYCINGCIIVPLYLIARCVRLGMGDVKLLTVVSLYVGYKFVIVISIISIILGGVCGIILIITKRKNVAEYIAFAPYVFGACLIYINNMQSINAIAKMLYGINI